MVKRELLLDRERQWPTVRVQTQRPERAGQLLRRVLPLRLPFKVRELRTPLKKAVEHVQVDARRCAARPLLKVERARVQLPDVLDQRVELEKKAAPPLALRLA